MTARRRSRKLLSLAVGPAGAAFLLLVVLPILAWPAFVNESSATPGPSPTPRSTLATGPSPTPLPMMSVSCAGEPGPLPSFLADDPCPSAILAVQVAAAPVRLPIERIVIEPGPFWCDVIWPGVQSAAVCFGVMVRPGQYMHAWASFEGSPKIAVVMLGLDLPPDGAPGATRPPWNATLVATEIPPDGWVMP